MQTGKDKINGISSQEVGYKRLLCPTTEARLKDKWLAQESVKAYTSQCAGSSVRMKQEVTHLLLIMSTEEVKDTITLLLFYLVVIWECSVYLWEMYFSGSSSETSWLRSKATGGSPHPSETHRAAGRRRPKDGHGAAELFQRAQMETVMRSRSKHLVK